MVLWISRFRDVARSNDPAAEESRAPRPLSASGTATFGIVRLERATFGRTLECCRQWTQSALASCLVDAAGPGQAPRKPVSLATPTLHCQCLRIPRVVFYNHQMLPSNRTPPQLLRQKGRPAIALPRAEMEIHEAVKLGSRRTEACAPNATK